VGAIVLVAVIAGCGGESAEEPAGVEIPGAEGETAADRDAPDLANGYDSTGDVSATGGVGGAPAEGGSLPLPQLLDRKIIRTATLELEVENVAMAVQEVESVAVAAGGFVSESNVFIDEPSDAEGDGGGEPKRTQSATVTIRVPAEVYTTVVSQLRDIAEEVRSERSEAAEVTEEYTDLQARLRNLEATEVSYLELLAKAAEIPDILTVQDRLNGVRLEIEQVQGRINLLDSLTDLATITVRLTLPAAVGEEPDGGKGWAEEAWDAAWEGSEDALVALGTIAIVGGVALVWLAVPALVGLAAWRRFGSRRPSGGEAGGGGPPV
jgi:hypothetical protein